MDGLVVTREDGLGHRTFVGTVRGGSATRSLWSTTHVFGGGPSGTRGDSSGLLETVGPGSISIVTYYWAAVETSNAPGRCRPLDDIHDGRSCDVEPVVEATTQAAATRARSVHPRTTPPPTLPPRSGRHAAGLSLQQPRPRPPVVVGPAGSPSPIPTGVDRDRGSPQRHNRFPLDPQFRARTGLSSRSFARPASPPERPAARFLPAQSRTYA